MSRSTRRVILANLAVPVIAWIIWDRYERRALAREIAALAARGEPTSAEAIATGGDTPDRYQAARLYASAAQYAADLPPGATFRLPRIDVDSVAVVESLAQLERTYPHDAPALQLLDRAAALDFNGFGEFSESVRLSSLSTLGYLCALRADLLAARGRAEAAALSLISCASLSRTMATFPRGQLSIRLLGSLRILLRRPAPPPQAWAALQQTLAALPDGDTLVADARAQRARLLDAMQESRAGLGEILLRWVMRPWIARSNRQVLRSFDEVLALAAQPWPQKLQIARDRMAQGSRFRVGPDERGMFARQFFHPNVAYAGFNVPSAALELAARRVAIAALAVERFRLDRRATPASLDALVPAYLPSVPVDPFSGRAIVYAASATEYRVYSVDQDLNDDGGAIYGLGSKSQRQPQQSQPRDLGVRAGLGR